MKSECFELYVIACSNVTPYAHCTLIYIYMIKNGVRKTPCIVLYNSRPKRDVLNEELLMIYDGRRGIVQRAGEGRARWIRYTPNPSPGRQGRDDDVGKKNIIK